MSRRNAVRTAIEAELERQMSETESRIEHFRSLPRNLIGPDTIGPQPLGVGGIDVAALAAVAVQAIESDTPEAHEAG